MSYINGEEKVYKISRSRLKRLLMAEHELNALEAGGVDNWSWYSDSRNDYLQEYRDEQDNEDLYFDDIAEQEIEESFEEV